MKRKRRMKRMNGQIMHKRDNVDITPNQNDMRNTVDIMELSEMARENLIRCFNIWRYYHE